PLVFKTVLKEAEVSPGARMKFALAIGPASRCIVRFWKTLGTSKALITSVVLPEDTSRKTLSWTRGYIVPLMSTLNMTANADSPLPRNTSGASALEDFSIEPAARNPHVNATINSRFRERALAFFFISHSFLQGDSKHPRNYNEC